MSPDCCVALPRGATGLSAVCDCGISWSCSLFYHADDLLYFNFVMAVCVLWLFLTMPKVCM